MSMAEVIKEDEKITVFKLHYDCDIKALDIGEAGEILLSGMRDKGNNIYFLDGEKAREVYDEIKLIPGERVVGSNKKWFTGKSLEKATGCVMHASAEETFESGTDFEDLAYDIGEFGASECEDVGYADLRLFHCSVCDYYICDIYDGNTRLDGLGQMTSDAIAYYTSIDFCPHCGRKIKKMNEGSCNYGERETEEDNPGRA